MSGAFSEVVGTPFQGAALEKLKLFLQEEELQYDDGIEYTLLLELDGEIVGTGSCHKNVMKCVAIGKTYQGQGILAQIMMHLIYHLTHAGISHYFIFTKPENQKIFEDMSFHAIVKTENVLLMENRKNGIDKYIEKLKQETDLSLTSKTPTIVEPNLQGEGIGAIIANCNPFTFGHRYLMERAAQNCRYLHVFVLAQSHQIFSEEERLELVRKGTQDIKNIVVHKASDYMVSPAVFPTYFIKDQTQAEKINCILDLTLFAEKIAPALKITKRFVGTEPNCNITSQYNECMKQYLPEHSVEYIEIKRKETTHQIISASVVRACMKNRDVETIMEMVPETTMQYISKKMEAKEWKKNR